MSGALSESDEERDLLRIEELLRQLYILEWEDWVDVYAEHVLFLPEIDGST
ncbi:GH22872 [Drosophila grimshawi]|uniref:GH22872 n=1 Tax=Drosophila grimshawi TaxID=7222 RepID=B4JVU7_DROGR|nr:GH22872 [Drosophila grimshawi]